MLEFVAPPGSGKSTLIKRLGKPSSVDNKFLKLNRFQRYLLPIITADLKVLINCVIIRILLIGIKTTNPAEKKFKNSIIRYYLIRSYVKPLYWEGELSLLSALNIKKTKLKKILKILKPDKVVFIDIPIEVSISRAKENRDYLWELDKETREKFYRNMKLGQNKIKRLIKNHITINDRLSNTFSKYFKEIHWEQINERK